MFLQKCENNRIETLSWLSLLSSHLSAKTLMGPSPLSSHFLGSPSPGSALLTEGSIVTVIFHWENKIKDYFLDD